MYHPYLGISTSETADTGNWMFTYAKFLGTYFALFSNIIPISLYVSMEFIKLCGAILISFDSDLCERTPEGKEKPIFVKTSNLLEELGQVRLYLFFLIVPILGNPYIDR